jgi:hypothetical protein
MRSLRAIQALSTRLDLNLSMSAGAGVRIALLLRLLRLLSKQFESSGQGLFNSRRHSLFQDYLPNEQCELSSLTQLTPDGPISPRIKRSGRRFLLACSGVRCCLPLTGPQWRPRHCGSSFHWWRRLPPCRFRRAPAAVASAWVEWVPVLCRRRRSRTGLRKRLRKGQR